jgi:hypothetical protein
MLDLSSTSGPNFIIEANQQIHEHDGLRQRSTNDLIVYGHGLSHHAVGADPVNVLDERERSWLTALSYSSDPP